MLVSLALLAGSALAAKLPSAGAAAPGCPCVILIEVDGLEPKDVTRETTPFLWELAHPEDGEAIDETERAGWTWQAPRSVMSAGTAANAAALLTGSYPEQNGVPADDFVDPEDGSTYRLEDKPIGAVQISDSEFESKSLLKTLPDETETTGLKQSAAFVGNPALAGLVDLTEIPATLKWWPTTDEDSDPQSPSNLAYCDPPRRMPDEPAEYRPSCSASDLVTLDKAYNALSSDGDRVALTYIHLAELGVIKRRDGDVPEGSAAQEVASAAAEESLPHALAQVDAAIAQFVARYTDDIQSPETEAKWEDTYLMVVGSHGYETAPHANRLPAPDGEPDLESYVEASGSFEYSPYGSMAAIHSTSSDPATRRDQIGFIAEKFKPGGEIEQACGEPCIKEVLYTSADLVPPEVLADDEERRRVLLPERYPHWHFRHVNAEDPTLPSTSGELIILTEPGWGTGRALPAPQPTSTEPVSDVPDPYLGVAGGPRNRAVAAIVNGPNNDEGVRQVIPDHYPVTTGEDVGPLDEDPASVKYESLAAANADPANDTEVDGHERQPESVDFAPTIAALLGIAIDDEQLAGRFLQEAFTRSLAFPELDPPPPPAPDPPPPPPPPPPPEPEVIILPPPPPPVLPPPKPEWRYRGLIRNLRAAVGDKRGRVFPQVPARADLSYLILRADFGKPLASVKLSFYKQRSTRRTGSAGARRTVVKTLATFDPFSIKRAKNAKLTLRVPKVFKPTHVGVVVQQARRLRGREAAAAKRAKAPLFKAYGAKVGGIYRIKNARRLHTVAPKRTRKR